MKTNIWIAVVCAAAVAVGVAITVALWAPEPSAPGPTLTREAVEVVSGQQMDRIPLGATVEEVTGLLGEPKSTSEHEDVMGVTVYLYYPYGTDFGDDWQLVFEDGKLRAKHRY